MAFPEQLEARLSKGGHRYIVRYCVLDAGDAMQAVTDWVHNRDLDFGWPEAAIIAEKIGRDLSAACKTFLPK